VTLAVRIIPCLDVKDGRVVKGVNFVDLRDAGDPVEQARLYDQQGADEICFLDISASVEGRGALLHVVEETASACFTPLTVGGGVRSADDVKALLRAGADKVAINTAAVNDPSLISAAAKAAGEQAIVVAIDAKRIVSSTVSEPKWEVFTHGGRTATGIDALEFAREAARRGAGEILLTSMDRDGAQTGYDLELVRTVAEAVSCPVVASGGVGTVEHLVEGVVQGKASAVLAASIFHFGTYTIRQAKEALANAGVPVRPALSDI